MTRTRERRKKKKHNPNARPPGYRRKLLAGLNVKYPYYNLKSNFLGGLFLVGLLLTIWEIYIYRVTFISVYFPLSIWVLTGLIMTPIFRRTFNVYCFNPYTPGQTPMFFHYFFNIVSFGGILVFLLMWANQNFTNHSKRTITASIISRGHLANSRYGCGESYVTIDYMETEKDLIFPYWTKVESYSTVYVEVENGLFGFDIMTNKTLIEGQW
jgi:hypothetical protein